MFNIQCSIFNVQIEDPLISLLEN